MKDYSYYAGLLSKRLSQMREEKGLSAREMSLQLLQCESYINKIENRKSLPSMATFFAICGFLEISPQDFFNDDIQYPAKIREIEKELIKLDEDKLSLILSLIRYLSD